ncbi:hypothetical protein D3C76_419010 [compost metagenome]
MPCFRAGTRSGVQHAQHRCRFHPGVRQQSAAVAQPALGAGGGVVCARCAGLVAAGARLPGQPGTWRLAGTAETAPGGNPQARPERRPAATLEAPAKRRAGAPRHARWPCPADRRPAAARHPPAHRQLQRPRRAHRHPARAVPFADRALRRPRTHRRRDQLPGIHPDHPGHPRTVRRSHPGDQPHLAATGRADGQGDAEDRRNPAIHPGYGRHRQADQPARAERRDRGRAGRRKRPRFRRGGR